MDKQAKSEVARQNWDAYVRARDAGHDEWVTDASKFDRFYQGGGKQWEDGVRQVLEAEGKPVLEINMILSTVNAMAGERIQQRSEIKFAPQRGGTEEMATAVLSPLARHIQDDNGYHFIEGDVFLDGLINDRGYFDVRMDFENDTRGEVRITSVDPVTVLPDPLARDYDTQRWNEVTTTRWLTLDQVETDYGKKHRDALKQFALHGAPMMQEYNHDCIEYAEEDRVFGNPTELTQMPELDNVDVLRVRVIERQYKRLGEQRVFVNNETGDKEPIPDDMSDEDAQARASQLNMSIVTEMRRRIRWTVTSGDHVIQDKWSPYDFITIIAYFPYFRRGKPFGVVRNLTSPQELLNKSSSQELHIVNTTANSGWQMEEGQVVNMSPQQLEAHGAKTGLVIVRRQGTDPLEKITPNSVPPGLSMVAGKAGQAIRTISGVHDAMLGESGAEISGVAIEAKLRRGLVQLQVPFDNLNRTRYCVGRAIYKLIQAYYTDERVYHVADFNVPGAPYRTVEINKQLLDGTVMHDITLGEYGVRIDIGPAYENLQAQQFAHAIEMKNAGVVIPDHVVIENSQLLHKTEVATLVRKLTGLAEPTPEDLEMQKMQMQFEMEMAMTELAQNKAKAMLLQAQAMQAQAKAGELEQGSYFQLAELQKDMDIELRKLDQRWAELQATLANKLELADVHASVKDDLTRYQTVAKKAMQDAQADSERRKVLLEAALRPATTGSNN